MATLIMTGYERNGEELIAIEKATAAKLCFAVTQNGDGAVTKWRVLRLDDKETKDFANILTKWDEIWSHTEIVAKAKTIEGWPTLPELLRHVQKKLEEFEQKRIQDVELMFKMYVYWPTLSQKIKDELKTLFVGDEEGWFILPPFNATNAEWGENKFLQFVNSYGMILSLHIQMSLTIKKR